MDMSYRACQGSTHLGTYMCLMYMLTNMNVPTGQKPQTNIETHICENAHMGLQSNLHSWKEASYIYVNTNTSGIDDFQLIDEISKN